MYSMPVSDLEDILCHVDSLIGAELEAGGDDNAKALVEEFKEWFMDYESGREIEVLALKVK
tara:strand:- start:478 stop:660 length:183 start_codon:yes stop_codon:yes gene_type:complete